jgi:hypothetical protein
LKLEKLVQGIIVNKPFSEEANYPLKQWDVITRIGDTPIDSEGMVKMGSNSRIRFNYLVQRLAKNGKLDLTIVRHGKEMKIQMPVQTDRPAVVPSLNGAYPSYFIYGPLAFSSATRELLGGSSDGMMMEWTQFLAANGNPLLGRIYDKPAFEGEGIVLIASPLFPHRLSKGYSNPIMQVVKSINGQKVRNLGHLVEIIRDSRDEFLTIEFDSRFGGETIVLPRTEALKATEEILTDNGIRSQGSSDTMAVWNAKPAK